MTANVASRIVGACEDFDVEAVGKHVVALDVQSLDVRSKVHQEICEVGINKLLGLLADCPCGDIHSWNLSMLILKLAVHSTAGIKRLIKAKNVMRKIVLVLRDSLTMYSVVSSEQVGKLIDMNFFVLRMCVHGTKPNHKFWTSICSELDFTRLFMWHKNLEKFDQAVWKEEVLEMIYVLQKLHHCSIKLCHKVKLACKVHMMPVIPETPSARLVMLMPLDRYIIFCSSPVCNRSVRQDSQYRHCARCMLSRYCSNECQLYHWQHGHRVQCCAMKDMLDEKAEAIMWCAQGPGYSCLNQ